MVSTMSVRDVDALMTTVAELTAVRSVDELRHDTVALLPRVVPTTLIAWNEVDLSTGHIEAVMSPNRTWDEGNKAWAEHIGSHPVINYFQATNDGRPYAISDFLSEESFHDTGIYQHFYRHLGAEDQLSFVLPHPDLLVGIALNREVRGFSRDDHRLANLLRPFLLQAYRNAAAFDRSRLLLDEMNTRMEADGEGLVLCDADGRLVDRTPGAADLLQRWFPSTAPTQMPSALADWLAVRGRIGPSWPLILDRDGARLLARRLPGPHDALTSVLLTEPPIGRARNALLAVGLTGRQADVVAIMAEGASNADIAERLDISIRTVDKHLQRAFDKLGVENRTAAANLVRQLERQG
jgi:DNA-binding CsgD family transcriptional regulator